MSSLWETQEVAGAALGLSEKEFEDIINTDEELLEVKLHEKFGVDLETFGNIVDALLPLCPVQESAIGGRIMHCFVVHELVGDGETKKMHMRSLMSKEAAFQKAPKEGKKDA